MIWWKRAGWTALLTLLAVLMAAGIYVWRSFPKIDGERRVPGVMAPVSVERDGADVTHLRAATPRDAWFALGYVHAQERGWQMEFNRRVMRGTLSEVLGEATLETDKLLRTLGIMEAARRQLARMPAEARAPLQAYSEGVQAFYADPGQALSPEFHLLGVRPGGEGGKAWDVEDCVGWALMMALDLGGNWGTEFARLSAAKVVDTRRLWELFPPYPGEPPASTVDFAALYAKLGVYRAGADAGAKPTSLAPSSSDPVSLAAADPLRTWSDAFARDVGLVEGKGSNNWVVAGSRTVTGKPLLANDPHLGLSAPAIWYFAGLHAPATTPGGAPALEVIGATLPGLPFVVLGRTRSVAWGFTNTGPDVQDLYLEQIDPQDPGRYRVLDVGGQPAWAAFETRQETIKVKGRPDVVLTVRSTRHGPVLSGAQRAHGDVIDLSRHVIALRWSALEAENDTVLGMKRANEARSVDQLVAAFAYHHSPMQSVVMADTAGRIGFKAVGKVPVRRADDDIRGIAPAPGWEARYDWAGWLPYADTPEQGLKDDRPEWIATANQRVTAADFPHFMGQDWAVPYRFDRIAQLLAATPRHDAASMQRIQADQSSAATLRLLGHLRAAVSTHPLAAAVQPQLAAFDGDMRADSAAALVFAVWVDELTRGLLVPRLGPERFAALYGKRQFRGTVELALEQNDAWWCAPIGCAAQAGAALTRALDRLQAMQGADVAQWQWGRAHPALSGHRPFSNVGPLARWFDVSVPSGGDSFTVNVGQYWPNDAARPFANRHAASLRAVYDLSDLEKSHFIYQTGQSGLVFSPRYRDMEGEWADVRYRALQLDPADVRHRLSLTR